MRSGGVKLGRAFYFIFFPMEWLILFFKKIPTGSTLATSARPPRVGVRVVYVPAVGRVVLSCIRSDGDEMKGH